MKGKITEVRSASKTKFLLTVEVEAELSEVPPTLGKDGKPEGVTKTTKKRKANDGPILALKGKEIDL